jgi:hypothetical protein
MANITGCTSSGGTGALISGIYGVDENGISSSMINYDILRISGNTGATTITSTPSIALGVDGQKIILKGQSNANSVTFKSESNLSGSKLKLDNGIDFTLGLGDVLELYYDAIDGYWYEIGRKNNE